jgi:hypothetical protein
VTSLAIELPDCESRHTNPNLGEGSPTAPSVPGNKGDTIAAQGVRWLPAKSSGSAKPGPLHAAERALKDRGCAERGIRPFEATTPDTRPSQPVGRHRSGSLRCCCVLW